MAYVPKGGPVPVHPWLLAIRFLQFFFAILIIATTAYPLSIDGGGPLKKPLIATLVAAILTIVPILPLTTPLHISQRRLYDPRVALVLDILATLLWLASFAALASYVDIFSDYGRQLRVVDVVFEVCGKCRSVWRSGVAATVFAAIEFLLFLFTTLMFIYYYHCHLAGESAYGLSGKKTQAVASAGTHDDDYGMTSPIKGPAIGGATAEERRRQETPSHIHNGLNGHSPTADAPVLHHGTAATSHPLASHRGAGTESNALGSPVADETEPINDPISPVSVSQFPQPHVSNHRTTTSSGANPPYPMSPSSPPRSPQSPTRPARPDEYGVETGSNVGPGADTTRL